MCDLTATEVYHEVEIGPHLQPVTGEQFNLNTKDRACLVISVNGSWGGKPTSYSMIVLYSRDHKGVGMAHEITSPKNQPQVFRMMAHEAVLLR